jgi:hypothetical protein
MAMAHLAHRMTRAPGRRLRRLQILRDDFADIGSAAGEPIVCEIRCGKP